MMSREITFKEGYHIARRAELGPFSSAFVALVWVLRGDKIQIDE
jgi:hypothetical protein